MEIRQALSIWKSNVQWRNIVQVKLKYMLRKKTSKLLKQSLTIWSNDIKQARHVEKYELLKNHLTNKKMLQKVFYAWKLTAQDSLAQKDLEKFHSL